MYRLTIIHGPNRGSSFDVQSGENSIGRVNGNAIVLSSGQVSKRHCVLVVSNGKILVKDENSANGTYVNGNRVEARELHSGDRIGIGQFVLELRGQVKNNIIAVDFSRPNMPALPQSLSQPASSGGESFRPSQVYEPQTPKEKFLHFVENTVMPFFYNINFTHEWRAVMVALTAVLVVGNLLITVGPFIQASQSSIDEEVARRAQMIAKQIVEKNAEPLAQSQDSRTSIGSLAKADGVRLALLVDLENRILAPSEQSNQYFSQGKEAVFAKKVAEKFRDGQEKGVVKKVTDDIIVAVEPVKVFSTRLTKNVVVGMAVVSIDASLSSPGFGVLSLVFSEALIINAIFAAFVLLIMYRLTLKPMEVLNGDLDRALKGEIQQVTREFKVAENDSLLDLINSAIQRLPKGSAGGGVDEFGKTSGFDANAYVQSMDTLATSWGIGFVACNSEKQVVSMNTVFEEMTGIHRDQAMGQRLVDLARDQGFASFVSDLLDRASFGQNVQENFDFSGIGYQLTCFAVGTGSDQTTVIVARKEENV